MYAPESRGVRLYLRLIPLCSMGFRKFWEQFRIAVDNRKDMSDAEKLVYTYLKHSRTVLLNHGWRSGDQYEEAIDSLKMQYNRPQLIHRARVKQFCGVPMQLEELEGSGSEFNVWMHSMRWTVILPFLLIIRHFWFECYSYLWFILYRGFVGFSKF